MFKANWRDCKEYYVHGEAKEVCILGPSDLSLNVCMEEPKLPCSSGILFFNRAYLQPDKVLEPHIGDTEEIHYILNGNGLFTYEDEVVKVMEGDVIYVPSGVKHGMKNSGKINLEYIVLGTFSK
jgi:gentisate 1,2-dioxygenase